MSILFRGTILNKVKKYNPVILTKLQMSNKKENKNYKYLFITSAITVGSLSCLYYTAKRHSTKIGNPNFIEDLTITHPFSFEDKSKVFSEYEREVDNYHSNQIASNDPIEDRLSIKKYFHNGKMFEFYGVFDGHSGFECSHYLKDLLPYYIMRKIKDSENVKENIKELIKEAFLELDKDLIEFAVENREMRKLGASGAVVLQAVKVGSDLFVAHTGDVRGLVLTSEGKLVTLDHGAENPAEVKRMENLHPNEEKLLYRQRVLGHLQPTRAFGDYSYKLPLKTLNRLKERTLPDYKTPPYVTAEPDVAHIKAEDGYMVISSDGVFDVLENEEIFNYMKEFEGNAATFIMKKIIDKLQAELSRGKNANIFDIPPPYSRRVRDDLSVLVVFFDKPTGHFEEFVDYGGVKDLLKIKSKL